MKALIIKDKDRRLKKIHIEEKQKCLKSLKHNNKLGLIRWARWKLTGLPKKKVNTRCIITGRGKAVNKTFKLSRLEFRRWLSKNLLPGLSKSSW